MSIILTYLRHRWPYKLSILWALCFCVNVSTHAGLYTVTKDKACPDAWALTDAVIPVISSITEPWGEPINGVDDKALAKAHVVSRKPIETLSKLPITEDDLVNDLLTVASECLVYRNFELDAPNLVAATPLTPNTATGWIPAVIY